MIKARTILRMPLTTAIAATVALTLIVVGFPAATTGAYLTATDAATSATGIGNWCSVPNPAVSKNVYKLSDFTAIAAPEASNNGTTSAVQMLVLPVVNDGSFDPIEPLPAQVSAVDNQLGVRLWSCTPNMSATQSIKLTAWRGDYAAPNASSFAWDVAPSASVSFAEARLRSTSTLAVNTATSSSTVPGVELRDLHRNINKLGGVTGGTDPVTMRYSWMLTTGRTSGQDSRNDPSCATPDCHVDGLTGVPNFNSVFSGNESAPPANAVSANSTTFLAEKYYGESGAWPASATKLQCSYAPGNSENWSAWEDVSAGPCQPRHNGGRTRSQVVFTAPPSPTPTIIAPANGMSSTEVLRDTTGTKIQYVVLEWWGAGTPPADLEVEVFVS